MAEAYYVSKKYHLVSELAKKTAKRIARNGEEWTKFLGTAARLYKYPFEDQMLIYVKGLCKAYAGCGNPLADMGKYGEWIEAADHAYIE